MRTKQLPITSYQSLANHPAISEAAAVIRAGGLVAFPTETVYGLGANALDPKAIAKIYQAKQRALNDPLIVHVADECRSGHSEESPNSRSRRILDGLMRADVLGKLNDAQLATAGMIIGRFWPGPLTLVLPRGERVPANVSAGLDTIAVRMPDHSIAQALIQASGVSIAAPSANRFGHVSPTTAQHVLDDLDGRIDLVLDGGPTRIGVESTVLDLSNNSPCILRPGGVTREQLAEVIGDWQLAKEPLPIANRQSPMASPGLLDKHYAPNARLIICRDVDELLTHHSSLVTRYLKVGALILESQRDACKHIHPQFVLGDTMSDIARNLYAGLRALDSAGVNVILVMGVLPDGIGEAIADRLKRAAAK